MTNEEASKGAIVRLKSGSPDMTIDSYILEGKVHCIWIDAQGHKQEGNFIVEALDLLPKR